MSTCCIPNTNIIGYFYCYVNNKNKNICSKKYVKRCSLPRTPLLFNILS